jgi:regulator of nucleoside diphosphate kinase
MQNTHVINQLDRVRVLESFADASHPRTHKLSHALACGDTPAHIARLLRRMQHAQPINPAHVPSDMVTMNSIVRLIDLDTLELRRVALVYDALCSHDTPPGVELVEIQEELGSELLARSVGDTIQLNSRTHRARLRIDALEYQPEGAGHLDR